MRPRIRYVSCGFRLFFVANDDRSHVLPSLQFPYPPPQANDPTKTLKSLVNIRKESLRLVRNMDRTSTSSRCRDVKRYSDSDIDKKPNRFNVEFVFDCDVRCAITIYYFCTEEVSTKGVAYVHCM